MIASDADFALVILFYLMMFMLGGACVYAVLVMNKALYFHGRGYGWGDAIKRGMKEVEQ